MTSLYELTNSWDKPARIRFVDTFSGDGLDTNRWVLNQIGGSICTATIDDSINGGLKMYANDTTPISASASLTFGDVLQFNPHGSTMIGNMIKPASNNDHLAIKYGLASDSTVTPPECVLMCEGNLHSYKGIETNNESRTDSTVAKSTDWFDFKLELNGGFNVGASINGVIAITKTSSIPTSSALQPFLYLQSRGAAQQARQWNTTYCEVWNH